jgi:hypothetical protein
MVIILSVAVVDEVVRRLLTEATFDKMMLKQAGLT